MDVERADARDIQNGLRQNETIGGDDQHVGPEGRQRGAILLGLEVQGLTYGNAQLLRKNLDRRGLELVSASGRPVRLAIGCNDLTALPGREVTQHRCGKVRRAHEDDTERRLFAAHAYLT